VILTVPKSLRLPCLALGVVVATLCPFPEQARAQSPELAMREFSSGQIKKGVRSIGFGGDGATWGNYGLVWLDAGTVLADYGDTHYTNGNDFHFAAVGVTSPSLWHHLAIYAIAMFQGTNDVRLNVKSLGLGPAAAPVIGNGSDDAVFVKIAMPLGKGVSVGGLLSHETSQFDATTQANPKRSVRYQTEWRPSGGFGVAWQPRKRMLFGFRGLLNNDMERRIDPAATAEGMAHTAEYRLGSSVSPWKGAWIDVGGMPHMNSRKGGRQRKPNRTVATKKIRSTHFSIHARARQVLEDMRRDPSLSLTRAARNRKIDPRTVRKHFSSAFRKESSGRIRAKPLGGRHKTLYIPSTSPGVSVPVITKNVRERRLLGKWMAALNAAGRNDFSKMKRFPRRQVIGGVHLATSPEEVQRILNALAEEESPFEGLYRTLVRPS
jgi:hypothetical protein